MPPYITFIINAAVLWVQIFFPIWGPLFGVRGWRDLPPFTRGTGSPTSRPDAAFFCDVHWGAEALDAKDRVGLRVGGMVNGWVGGLSFKLVQNSTLPTMSNDPLPVSKDHPHPGRDPPDFFGRLARPVHGSIFWVFGPKNPVSNDRTA